MLQKTKAELSNNKSITVFISGLKIKVKIILIINQKASEKIVMLAG
jgi:hypothetical protein